MGQGLIYPNLYILLISPPGIGKSEAIRRTATFWQSTEGMHVAPDSMTSASLIDELVQSNTRVVSPDKQDFLSFHALSIAADEFSVFMPAHEPTMIGTLTHLYNNPLEHKERRRGNNNGEPIIIPRPSLNILAGAQPAFLSELLPEYAWGQGFTARLLMVYSATQVEMDYFAKRGEDRGLRETLQLHLNSIMQLFGGMTFEDEAIELFRRWQRAGWSPAPTHSRLVNYSTRRPFYVLKLSMISAASRGSVLIQAADFNRARNWLLEIEVLMPDIFRDMAGKSDRLVLDDLYSYLWTMYSSGLGKGKSVHEARIYEFLRTKVPAEKAPRVLDLAERSGMIEREAGTASPNAKYRPRPLEGSLGLE